MNNRKAVYIVIFTLGFLALSFIARCVVFTFDYNKFAYWQKDKQSVVIVNEPDVRNLTIFKNKYVFKAAVYMPKPWNFLEDLVIKSEYKDTDPKVQFIMDLIRNSKQSNISSAIYNYSTGDISVN